MNPSLRHIFFFQKYASGCSKKFRKRKLGWRDICTLPGAKPIPDRKGVSDYYSRFAVSKAIVAYFVIRLAVFGKKINLDQNRVTDILINEDSNDEKGKRPTEFNHKQYRLTDWISTL